MNDQTNKQMKKASEQNDLTVFIIVNALLTNLQPICTALF